jgi:hypothetical protein
LRNYDVFYIVVIVIGTYFLKMTEFKSIEEIETPFTEKLSRVIYKNKKPQMKNRLSLGTFERRAQALLKTGEQDVGTTYHDSSVIVAVRVRPFSVKEEKQDNVKNVISMDGNVTVLESAYNLAGGTMGSSDKAQKRHEFAFDFSFWSFDEMNPKAEFKSQEAIYNQVGRPLLERSFEGYNTCLFAYGQTGSGKSYTMTGYDDEEAGIIPRFCDELFDRVDMCDDPQYSVEISYYEIYNEKIHDSSNTKSWNNPCLFVIITSHGVRFAEPVCPYANKHVL